MPFHEPHVLAREDQHVERHTALLNALQDRQELVEGYGAVAAPVRVGGEVIPALTVVAPISRLDVPAFAERARPRPCARRAPAGRTRARPSPTPRNATAPARRRA